MYCKVFSSIVPIVCGLLCGFVLATAANAAVITVTPVDCRIWGDWTEQWMHRDGMTWSGPYTNSDTFDYSTTDTLSQSVSAFSSPHGAAGVSVTLDALSLSMEGWADPNGVEYSNGDELLRIGRAIMYIERRTSLRPEVSSLSFNLSADSDWNYSRSEQSLSVTLRDVTSVTNLMNWDLTDPYDAYMATGDYTIDVDPAHEYEFAFAGHIDAWDAKYANLSVVITIIPEPTTFALLGLGSLALVMVRRRS